MTKQAGFTLIEVIIFIVITAVLATTILLVFSNSLQKAPSLLQNLVAAQTAEKCTEWFIGQRKLNGYDAISCPSTSVPAFCTAPTGYNLSVNISCASINSDPSYQAITVTVSGSGTASLTTLIAKY